MDNQTRQVLKGYLTLSSAQRKDIADIVEKQQGGRIEESKVIKDAGISMGPSGSGCPCCGR